MPAPPIRRCREASRSFQSWMRASCGKGAGAAQLCWFEIRDGRCYIYRVLSPQLATLSVAKGPDGGWQIQQLFLSCNRPVSPETWQFVQKWLNQFSLSI